MHPGFTSIVCDPCRGDVVELSIGTQATLAIEVQSISPAQVTIASIALADESDDAFVVLAPVAVNVAANDAVDLFIGVTPVDEGPIEATVVVDCDGTGRRGPYEIGLQVMGVTP